MSTYGRRIPNWQDRDAYPKSFDDIYEGDWRWEFLRRCPEYQQAWSRGVPDDDITYHVDIDEVDRKPAPEDSEICRTVFRLTRLVDPWGKRRIPHRSMMHDANTGALTINPPDKYHGRDGHLCMVTIDLNRPLKSQLNDAYPMLKNAQESHNKEKVVFRRHTNLWPLYLRILDAQAQGDPAAMKIYNYLLNETKQHDVDLYDAMCVDNPATLISDWQTAAIKVRNSATRYL